MANIFEIAETYGEADYFDMHTGYTYHIAAWKRAKRFGLPNLGIAVTDESGKLIGYVHEEDK